MSGMAERLMITSTVFCVPGFCALPLPSLFSSSPEPTGDEQDINAVKAASTRIYIDAFRFIRFSF
jgi:hypothetical protein